MKQFLAVPLLLLSVFSGYAQNKNLGASYAFKLYNLTSWQRQATSQPLGMVTLSTSRKDFRFLHPTAAFRLTNKHNNMHEIELSNLELGSVNEVSAVKYPPGSGIPVSGGKTTQTTIALRYEYIINFMKKKNSKWMPGLGLALMPYFEQTSFKPAISVVHPEKITRLGTKGWIIPRINYAINSRLFLDLNVPLCITDLNVEWKNQINPTLPQGDQKSAITSFEGAPYDYSVRLGLGLKI